MDSQNAVENIQIIRNLMERPVKYSTQSGLAGIIAGLAALGGTAADWWITGACAENPEKSVLFCMFVWAAVFLVAFAGVTILTRLREKKQNMPFWSQVKKRILMAILPPFVAGMGMTLVIVAHWAFTEDNYWNMIAPLWMLFYGIACWQVGEFSIKEIRWMGTAFIIAGLISAAFFSYDPNWTLGITFGGFHLCYGVIVWIRHGG